MTPQSPAQPVIRTAIPGPLSRAWLARLGVVESPDVTFRAPDFPVVWASAEGACVTDVDGNTFIDASAAFGVALVGHRHPRVVTAVQEQSGRLVHGMGDVHPTAVRIELLERLAGLMPFDHGQGVLCTGGSEAVEVAIKTAVLATGKPGLLSFAGGYHGLSLGALAATARRDFSDPFAALISPHRHVLPFVAAGPGSAADAVAASLAKVDDLLRTAEPAIGLVIVEPIQGRGGTNIAADGWLAGLRAVCDARGALLCFDEIFTGCGRTGSWLAAQKHGAVADLVCIGKALGGGWPIAACFAPASVMAAWGKSTGEALHTSTFLGHPLACAAAIATLDVIENEALPARCQATGDVLLQRLRAAIGAHPAVREVRGRGLMIGVELRPVGGVPAGVLVGKTMTAALRRGLVLLPSGPGGAVLQLTPPAIISEAQVATLVRILTNALHAAVQADRDSVIA